MTEGGATGEGKGIDPRLQINSLMRRYAGAVPGACVAVCRPGHAAIELAYGLADCEQGTSCRPDTNYRIASIAKQFTAAAVLLLHESGALRLEDAVRDWLPALPESCRGMTVHHLLTHTSGVVDYEDLIAPGTRFALRYPDVLQLLQGRDERYFAPGSSYRYSNSGYVLLASIVERASGEKFSSFLGRRIFEPLQMAQTVAHEEGISVISNRAYGYRASGSSWLRADQSLTSATLGDGGIYSSIRDLARWDAALYGERLLRADSLKLAVTPAVQTDDPAVRYGYGWRITGESLWHSGESCGFRSVLVRFPAHGCTVILLTNRDAPEPYSSALAIAKLFVPGADSVRARVSTAGPDSGARPIR